MDSGLDVCALGPIKKTITVNNGNGQNSRFQIQQLPSTTSTTNNVGTIGVGNHSLVIK